jgi:Sec-independent protein secretion pathway component TatC
MCILYEVGIWAAALLIRKRGTEEATAEKT